jgi:hypothetical protein
LDAIVSVGTKTDTIGAGGESKDGDMTVGLKVGEDPGTEKGFVATDDGDGVPDVVGDADRCSPNMIDQIAQGQRSSSMSGTCGSSIVMHAHPLGGLLVVKTDVSHSQVHNSHTIRVHRDRSSLFRPLLTIGNWFCDCPNWLIAAPRTISRIVSCST